MITITREFGQNTMQWGAASVYNGNVFNNIIAEIYSRKNGGSVNESIFSANQLESNELYKYSDADYKVALDAHLDKAFNCFCESSKRFIGSGHGDIDDVLAKASSVINVLDGMDLKILGLLPKKYDANAVQICKSALISLLDRFGLFLKGQPVQQTTQQTTQPVQQTTQQTTQPVQQTTQQTTQPVQQTTQPVQQTTQQTTQPVQQTTQPVQQTVVDDIATEISSAMLPVIINAMSEQDISDIVEQNSIRNGLEPISNVSFKSLSDEYCINGKAAIEIVKYLYTLDTGSISSAFNIENIDMQDIAKRIQDDPLTIVDIVSNVLNAQIASNISSDNNLYYDIEKVIVDIIKDAVSATALLIMANANKDDTMEAIYKVASDALKAIGVLTERVVKAAIPEMTDIELSKMENISIEDLNCYNRNEIINEIVDGICTELSNSIDDILSGVSAAIDTIDRSSANKVILQLFGIIQTQPAQTTQEGSVQQNVEENKEEVHIPQPLVTNDISQEKVDSLPEKYNQLQKHFTCPNWAAFSEKVLDTLIEKGKELDATDRVLHGQKYISKLGLRYAPGTEGAINDYNFEFVSYEPGGNFYGPDNYKYIRIAGSVDTEVNEDGTPKVRMVIERNIAASKKLQKKSAQQAKYNKAYNAAAAKAKKTKHQIPQGA